MLSDDSDDGNTFQFQQCQLDSDPFGTPIVHVFPRIIFNSISSVFLFLVYFSRIESSDKGDSFPLAPSIIHTRTGVVAVVVPGACTTRLVVCLYLLLMG